MVILMNMYKNVTNRRIRCAFTEEEGTLRKPNTSSHPIRKIRFVLFYSLSRKNQEMTSTNDLNNVYTLKKGLRQSSIPLSIWVIVVFSEGTVVSKCTQSVPAVFESVFLDQLLFSAVLHSDMKG